MPATHFINKLTNTNVEEVVISGTSCRFPDSMTVEQYSQRLLNLKKEITKPVLNYEFDYQFYGITSEYAEKMTLESKYFVECAYDAMVDSGMIPTEFKGTRTGVFFGMTESEQKKFNFGECVSTVFDFKGPMKYFYQYCSSFFALEAAYRSIFAGECDQAIVTGIDMFGTYPSVGCVFLQRKEVCKRFYAKFLASKVYHESEKLDSEMLREFYNQWNIDPTLVTYVENYGQMTHGIEEYTTLARVFAPSTIERTLPVYFGSVQRMNVQERYPSGIYALIKMMVSIQCGTIPASYEHPEWTIARDAKFVQTNSKFYGGLMALNSFEIQNCHIVLQPNTDYWMSKLGKTCYWNQELKEVSTLPRLFTFSAKTQEGLEKIMEEIRQYPTDMAYQFLMSETTMQYTSDYFRGFCILNSDKTIQRIEQITKRETRPIWYIFSGLNAEWFRCYSDMMKIESFYMSIQQSAEYLRPYGFDLVEILRISNTEQFEKKYGQTLYAFVGITAIQMALVDCLYQAGIKVDGLIGHSIGELACAYADKALTAEETILTAYWRGKVIEDAKLPAGAMAVVGLTWEQAQKRCPVGVVPACYNHEENVTVSGPAKLVQQFVQQLTTEGIYAKEFNTHNIAYHSHFMNAVAPQMKSALEKVITTPRQRSTKWISTSIPEQRWSSSIAKYASADYFVNNLCSDVHFKTALKHVPANAIVIEMGPCSVMQAILKKALSSTTMYIPLMGQLNDNQLIQFWTQLGYMYNYGVQFYPMNMFVPRYRNVTMYPVPVNTKFLSTRNHRLNKVVRSTEQTKNLTTELKKDLEHSICYEQQLVYIRNLMKQEHVTTEQKRVLEELENLVKQTQLRQTKTLWEELYNGIYRLEGLYTVKSGQQWRWIQELKETYNKQWGKFQQFMTTPVHEKPVLDRFALIKQFLKMENLSVQQRRILEELDALFRRTTFNGYMQQVQYYQYMLRLIEDLDMLSLKQDQEQTRIIQLLKEFVMKSERDFTMSMNVPVQKVCQTAHPKNCECVECIRLPTATLTGNKYVFKYTFDFSSCLEDSFLMNQKINGKTYYPASAFIYLVWKTFCRMNGYETVEEMPVQFYNIKFLHQVVLSKTDKVYFTVEINCLTGLFEILESGRTVVTGCIEPLSKLVQLKETITYEQERYPEIITQSEIYKVLRQRGYELQNEFMPITKASLDGLYGELSWTGRWISVLDGMIQMNILAQKIEGCCLPTMIKCLRIEPNLFLQRSFKVQDQNNNFVMNNNWLEEEYQYIMNGKIEKPTTVNRQYQWIQKFMTYQQEQLALIRDMYTKYTFTVEQRRIFEELETSFQFCTYKTDMYKFLAHLQYQMDLIYSLKSLFSVGTFNESSDNITDLRRIIREQLTYQINQQKIQLENRTEERTFTDLLRKQLDILRTLTQSQCKVSTEMTMLQQLEKIIMEQQYFFQSKQQLYTDKISSSTWMQQVQKHHDILTGYYTKYQQTELRTIWTFLEDMIREQLQHELDFQTDRKQMYGTIQQRLTMNLNLVQKLMYFSRTEQSGLKGDVPIKKMYLEKLEQLIQEMYEQNMLTTAIEESMQDSYEVKRVKLQEYLDELEKFDFKKVEYKKDTFLYEIHQWQTAFERFRNQANEFLQFSTQKSFETMTVPVFYNSTTKTMMCRGIEMTGLYLAPLMTVTPVVTVTPLSQLWTQESRYGKNDLYEMDLMNLIEAMHSLESIRETESLPVRQMKPVSAKLTTKITYSPLREYVNLSADELERQLIEETLESMKGSMKTTTVNKKVNYLMPQKTIVPLNQVDLYEVGQYKPTPVVIIHPIEGHTNTLKNLARYIRSPVYGVQYTRQAMQYETVEELARFYLSKIQAQFGEERVHLCGHAFGSFVAMEMSSIKPSRFVSLTLLDDNTPRKTYKMSSDVSVEMESDALFRFAQMYFVNMNETEFYHQLTSLHSLNQRVRYVVRELMNRSQFTFEPIDLEYAARAFVTKYIMMMQYTPVQELRMPTVYLIKSGLQQSLVQIRTQLENFLEHYFSGRLYTEFVDCDFRSFLEGHNGYLVASILNENYLRHF